MQNFQVKSGLEIRNPRKIVGHQRRSLGRWYLLVLPVSTSGNSWNGLIAGFVLVPTLKI